MIAGVGIDRARVDRVTRLLQRHPERARRRLFTPAEREACDSRQRPAECYAARFAAKEAFVKAIGTGLRDGMRWTDIEVVTDGRGRPGFHLRGAARDALARSGGARAHLSFTHEGGVAVAVVIVEGPVDSP